MKIVYCLDNIYDHGGIVQITLTKANAFAKLYGYEVYLVVIDNSHAPLIPLEEEVFVYDLSLGRKAGLINHWCSLYRAMKIIRPNVVVSVGLAERRLLQFLPIVGKPIKIREFHFVRNYMELQAKTFFAKLHVIASEIFDNLTNFVGYDKIVVLTEEDKKLHWGDNKKVVVIPNPLTNTPQCLSDCKSKVVIAAGRLTEQKNFSSLLRIWKNVEYSHPDWRLQIWGDGWQEQLLRQEILSLKLKNVRLMGHSDSLLKEMAKASIYAMTSVFEGLPLVLIEAMSVGLPIISYACPCGPKDIVTDGKDGILIPMNDECTFARELCRLMDDETKRIDMGANAKEKAKLFSLDKIMNMWIDLFNLKKI